MDHDMMADAMATALWEITTGNGRNLNPDDWDSHRAACAAAVTYAWREDMDHEAWEARALERLGYWRLYTVEGDSETGEWIGEPEATGELVEKKSWSRMVDDAARHCDHYTFDTEAPAERAILVTWTH